MPEICFGFLLIARDVGIFVYLLTDGAEPWIQEDILWILVKQLFNQNSIQNHLKAVFVLQVNILVIPITC